MGWLWMLNALRGGEGGGSGFGIAAQYILRPQGSYAYTYPRR